MSDPKTSPAARPATPEPVSRRAAIQGLSVGIGLVAVGCGAETEPSPTTGQIATTPPTQPPGGPSGAAPSADSPPTAPAAKPALTPADLLAGIDHIVVVMMENRSFDHVLGSLATDPGYAARAQIEGLTGNETNPDPGGAPVKVFKLTNFTPEDPPHSWDASHAQFNGGKNDGFVKAHAGPSQAEAMGYHDRSQLPLYYWFADNFTVCDSWHASVMGPTWPNRYCLHATTAKGKKDNTPFVVGPPDTVWDRLKASGKTYKNYVAGKISWFAAAFPGKLVSNNPIARVDEFFDAATKGTLPNFSIIDPDFQASDDHPSHDMHRGQAFVASVYKALAESPLWSKCMLVVMYDEHGGFFDHVAPPKTVDDDADFRQLGFRVPAFIIGPTVRKGYVCKTLFDHVSVAATLRTRWGVESLGLRMSDTSDLSSCVDPAKVEAPAPPPIGMPQVAMTMDAALHHRVGPSSQPMLEELAARGAVSVLDERSDDERIGAWLRRAVDLGAVRIVPG